jgi:MFS family permease
MSDRMPRRKPFVVGGYALATLSRAWIGVAGRWPSVLGARLLDRTGKGVRSAPRDAIIADVTPPPLRGRAFGFQRALDHTGAVVGPLIALTLLQVWHVPMRHVFLIAVIPGAIGVVILALLLREPERRVTGGRQEAMPAVPLPSRFWAALGAIGLFSLANSSDAYLILQAHAAGVATAMLPLLWSAHHVIKSLFSTAAGALSDRIGRRWLLVAGWTFYAAIYFVFPLAHTLPFFFALFVAYAIPGTLTEGAERAWIGDIVPAAARGRSFGLYYLITGIGVLGGTALFGEIFQRVSAQAAFTTGAGLSLGAALAVAIIGRRQSS